MNMIPKRDMVLLKRYVVEKTAGGIILSKRAQEGEMRMSQGEVVSIGPDVTDVQKGERVVFGKYAGVDHEVNGDVFILMQDVDVLATIKEYYDE